MAPPDDGGADDHPFAPEEESTVTVLDITQHDSAGARAGDKLKGRVALVTGGRRGIGAALRHMAEHGSGRVVCVSSVIHFLAADASSYITGQVWGVSGGLDM